MPYILLEQVTKRFDGNKIGIQNASLEIEKGEFVFFVGKSGSGKTTLIKLISRQYKPTEGVVIFEDEKLNDMPAKKIPYLRRKMGVITQETGLLETRTVYENIAFAMLATEQAPKVIQEAVPTALGMVGMRKKADRLPSEISGGERIRVALARAIVNNPQVLIADEPTANLDADSAWDIMCLLKEINHIGITVLVATHAKELVNIMKKRVVTLNQGKIIGDVKKGKYGDTISAYQYQRDYALYDSKKGIYYSEKTSEMKKKKEKET